MPSIALLIAMPLFEVGLFQSTAGVAMEVLLPAHISLFVFYTPTLAIAQNMVSSNMRASSSFTVNIVLGLVGIGFGPTIVGVISDFAANRYFDAGTFAVQCPGGIARVGGDLALANACSSASAHGIQVAMGSITLLLLVGSLFYFLAARTLRADMDTHYLPPTIT